MLPVHPYPGCVTQSDEASLTNAIRTDDARAGLVSGVVMPAGQAVQGMERVTMLLRSVGLPYVPAMRILMSPSDRSVSCEPP
jgi:hypothetical protein